MESNLGYEIAVYGSSSDAAIGIDTFSSKETAIKEAEKLFESGKYFGVMVVSFDTSDNDPIKWIKERN